MSEGTGAKTSLSLLCGLLLLTACSTSPTGRQQLTLLPEDQMAQLGAQSFSQMKKQNKTLSTDTRQFQLASCVSDKILRATGKKTEEWEVEVFEDPSANAFALPGKKIGVHTGMIDLIQNADQLAAVIGHEIGHVIAQHGNERVSQNLVVQGGLAATSIALGQDGGTDRLILAGLGLGAQYGVLLPFSRKHEKEADMLGLSYMAEAGFRPKAAVELWQLMSQQSEGSPPEFLSTHPNPESRIGYLEEEIAKKNLQANDGTNECSQYVK